MEIYPIRIYWANDKKEWRKRPRYYAQKWNEEKQKYDFLYGSESYEDIVYYILRNYPHCGWVYIYNAYFKKYRDGGIGFGVEDN